MEQKKTGQFIAELRKEMGLTQKKLAEQLHITDKAVSKWECGNSLPDTSVMVDLCNVLGISVNELLSGERLSSVNYNRKAEENIMALIQENSKNLKKDKRRFIISAAVVILLAAYFIWFIDRSTASRLEASYFLDFIAMNVDIILPFIMLILAKQLKNFMNLFRYNIHKCDDSEKTAAAKSAASFAIKCELVAGGICSFIYLVNWLRCIDNMAYFGPNLAHIVMGLFYSLIISGILLILKERI